MSYFSTGYFCKQKSSPQVTMNTERDRTRVNGIDLDVTTYVGMICDLFS